MRLSVGAFVAGHSNNTWVDNFFLNRSDPFSYQKKLLVFKKSLNCKINEKEVAFRWCSRKRFFSYKSIQNIVLRGHKSLETLSTAMEFECWIKYYLNDPFYQEKVKHVDEFNSWCCKRDFIPLQRNLHSE